MLCVHAIESTQSVNTVECPTLHVQKLMRTISLGFGSSSEAVVTRLIDCFDILRNQAKTKDSCANTVQSLSLSLSLSLSYTFTTCYQSLHFEDRPTCLIRGKQAYQEL